MLNLTKFGTIPSQASGLWLEGWDYGKKITIPADSIDADLAYIPLPVYLNSTNFDFTKCKPDGADIRFTDKNLNPLKFERVEHKDKLLSYARGDENIPKTYGWITGWVYSAGTGTGTQSKETDHFYLKCTNANTSSHYIRAYETNSKINVTEYKTLSLVIDGVFSGVGNFSFGLCNTKGVQSDWASVVSVSTTGLGQTATLDVTGLSGEYYIKLQCNSGYTKANSVSEVSIYEVKLSTDTPFAKYNVNLPTVSNTVDTEVYMWYGNADAYNTSIEAWRDQTGKALTYNGNVKLITGVESGKRVASFDGTGDYFTVPDSEDFHLSADFTAEFKVKLNSIATDQCFFSQSTGSGYSPFALIFYGTQGNKLQLLASSNGTTWNMIAPSALTSTSTLSANIEYDITVERDGNTITIYIDDVPNGSITTSAIPFNSTAPFSIGQNSGTQYVNGNFMGTRIAKSIARHSEVGYTTPDVFEVDQYTVFCTNFDTIYDSNYAMVQHMGDSLVDATGNGNALTNVGTTVVDTTHGKARLFSSNTTYLTGLASATNYLNWTQLFDFYIPTATAQDTLIGGGSNGALNIMTVGTPDNQLVFNKQNMAEIGRTTTGSIVFGAWNTCEISYDSTGVYKIYINGVLNVSGTNLQTFVNQAFTIGKYNDTYDYHFDGQIANIRFSNIVRSDAWIKAESLALKNELLTFTDL